MDPLLFAATRFESAKGGTVKFLLTGDVKRAWLNGQLVKTGAQFSVQAKAGGNTLVLQLNDVKPDTVTLRSGDVNFSLGQ